MALPPEEADTPPRKAPAREKSQQDVFMREVDEALRQDEMSGFFQRFGIPLAIAVVLGLVGLGGYLWWDGRQTKAAAELSEQYIVALDELEAQNLDGANEKLAVVAQQGSGINATSAKLMRAGIALEQDRPADAIKLYAEVSADTDVPEPLRNLATIREVAASFDKMKPETVVARLKPLAVEGSPWFGVAGELVGMAYLKQGKEDLAGPLFAQIARDEDLPDSLRGRARQLAGMLGVDALDDTLDDQGEKGGNKAGDKKSGEGDEDAAPAQAN